MLLLSTPAVLRCRPVVVCGSIRTVSVHVELSWEGRPFAYVLHLCTPVLMAGLRPFVLILLTAVELAVSRGPPGLSSGRGPVGTDGEGLMTRGEVCERHGNGL